MNENKDGLVDIVGDSNVLDDPETLVAYSRDESFTAQQKPRLVVKPANVDEVQGIVEWANRTRTPLIPVSSGPPRFRGDTVPSMEGAVIVDLSRMKRIIRIDRRNRVTMIEPGVLYSELQPAVAKEGMRVSLPLMPRGTKSVTSSLLEREPTLIPRYNWTLPDPLRCLEVVWGNGEKLWTGDAGMRGSLEKQWETGMAQSVPMGPLSVDYHRLVSAAQGTMGIITWATVKCEILPQIHKFLLIPAQKLDELLDFAYRNLKFKYGDELLFLNNTDLACILAESADGVRALKEKLPPWVLILGLAGRQYLARERVEYQEKDINNIAQEYGLKPASEVPGATGEQVMEAILNPSPEPYWKLRYRGGCQDILFLTTLDKTPGFVETMYTVAGQQGYEPSDIGVYIQPQVHGSCCHCEFSLPFDPVKQEEANKIKGLLTAASDALFNQGAYFSRPYGMWADMVYGKDTQNAAALKKVKDIFDPNHVMNPGKLCL